MIGPLTDWDLSELGIEQAKRIGERLSPEIRDKGYIMYSSDLLRAKHTAEIAAGYLDIEPIFTDRSRERNLGETVGKSVECAHQPAESACFYRPVYGHISIRSRKKSKQRLKNAGTCRPPASYAQKYPWLSK